MLLKQIIIVFSTFNEATSRKGYLLFFPQLVKLEKMFPKLSGWNKLEAVAKPMRKIFDDAVLEHEMNPLPEDNNPRDFIDVYMQEIKKTTDPSSSFYKEAGREEFKHDF